MNDKIRDKKSHFTIILSTLTGKHVQATVQEILATEGDETAGKAQTCIMRLELAFATMQEVISNEYFHLFSELISKTQTPHFDQEKPVELEVILRKEILTWFATQKGKISELPEAIRLAARDEEKKNPLLQTESWKATTVTQHLELPPEISEGAFASVGFRTVWAHPNQSLKKARTLSLEELATQYLQASGLKPEHLGDGILRTRVSIEDRSWVMLVMAEEQERTVGIWSVYPKLVPEPQRAKIASFLLGINYETPVGSFEMDADDGEIRYRTSLDAGNSVLNEELFARLLQQNVNGMVRVGPLIDLYLG